jgi:hypothetical protein
VLRTHAAHRSPGRRRARRGAVALAGVVVALALALGGVWLGLRAASPGEYETELGRVSVRITPAAHGQVEAFVPLANWGVRARAFDAPMKLHVEPRTVDREVVLRAAGGEREPVRAAEAGLREAVRKTILRTVRFALGGAALLALVLGLTLAALRIGDLRLVAGAPLAVVALAAAICGIAVWRAQATFDERAFDHPTFYARGAELVQLLDAASNARAAGDGYTTKVQSAVRGFASLLTDPEAGRLDDTRAALLASDLHNNRLVVDSLRDYARDKPVFFVGDFGNTGNRTEAKLLGGAVAGLGRQVVAVSGNHDSTSFMRTLARHRVIVLTRDGVLRGDGSHGAESVVVDGLRVAGFDDPQEWHGTDPDDPRRIFSFSELPDAEQAIERARASLLRWFDGLELRPDVVLVHQNGLAQWLASTLQARGDGRPLAILTGHDHRQHVTGYGAITVVDAGTAGASGLYGVGHDEVGLGDLRFSPQDRVLQAADLIAVEPVSGAAQAQRVLTAGACPQPHAAVCRRFPAPEEDAEPPEG